MHVHDEEHAVAAKESTPRREGESPLVGAVLSLQRSAGNAGVAAWLGDEEETGRSPVLDVVGSGGGAPLDGRTRGDMETALGHDFSDVRVHTDGAATASARSVGAAAYTVGRDVVVQADRWSPETDAGRQLLAHELTHVVQQRSGPVDGTDAGGGIRMSDPSDRFEQEAERSAQAVVQRQEEEDEEEPDEFD